MRTWASWRESGRLWPLGVRPGRILVQTVQLALDTIEPTLEPDHRIGTDVQDFIDGTIQVHVKYEALVLRNAPALFLACRAEMYEAASPANGRPPVFLWLRVEQ